jgi:hypothetical protein
MHRCETTYPNHHLYKAPAFVHTGLTIIDTHRIRAQYFSNDHGVPYDPYRLNLTDPRTIQELCTLIQLKIDVFPGWKANQHQYQYILEHYKYWQSADQCAICGLIKGTYCDVSDDIEPASESTSWRDTTPLNPLEVEARAVAYRNRRHHNNRQRHRNRRPKTHV